MRRDRRGSARRRNDFPSGQGHPRSGQRLPLLPADDLHVAEDLRKVGRGALLSPVLLVRGPVEGGLTLIMADGYHRTRASYNLDENADIPFRLVDVP